MEPQKIPRPPGDSSHPACFPDHRGRLSHSVPKQMPGQSIAHEISLLLLT